LVYRENMAQLEERFGALEASSRDMVAQVSALKLLESKTFYASSSSGKKDCSTANCETMVLWVNVTTIYEIKFLD
jgi:hypothetical protein